MKQGRDRRRLSAVTLRARSAAGVKCRVRRTSPTFLFESASTKAGLGCLHEILRATVAASNHPSAAAAKCWQSCRSLSRQTSPTTSQVSLHRLDSCQGLISRILGLQAAHDPRYSGKLTSFDAMTRWLPLLACAASTITGEACSCASGFIHRDEAFVSPAQKLFRAPFVFTGHVVSVKPADSLPLERSAYCASLRPETDTPWGDPCEEDPLFQDGFDRWASCRRPQVATVEVTEGFKGISTGSMFAYNCTLASCGDCSPPCPEVRVLPQAVSVSNGAEV